MKKKNILWSIIIFLLIVLGLITYYYRLKTPQKPPDLMVSCNTGEEVWTKEATLGSYGWSWFGGAVHSDSISPLEMEEQGFVTSFLIDSDEGDITLHFPKTEVTFSVYSESIEGDIPENIITDKTLSNSENSYSFTAKVNYVHTVVVKYKNGTVNYVFAVKSKCI